MFKEVYRNQNLRGLGIGPLLETGCMFFLGGALLSMMLIGLVYRLLVFVHVLSPVEPPYSYSNDEEPWYVGLIQGFFFIGFGAACIGMATKKYLRLRQSRNYLSSKVELASVEGDPLFEEDSESAGLLGLSVGGKTFDLIECSNKGCINNEDFTWGESTSIRGVLRVWYIPSNNMVVSAEWRSYEASEIVKKIDDFIRENRAWNPDVAKLVPQAANDPKIRRDCEKLIDNFRKLIEEDCDKLEKMKPDLLPGVPMKKRRKAEEEYGILVSRIGFNKHSIKSGAELTRIIAG